MLFNKHSHLTGRHAFLSASNNAWTNYDEEKLERVFSTSQAAKRGSELHDFARMAIYLGERLPAKKRTLNLYVNESISFGMTPELTLYYSDNAFGTTDALSFRRYRGKYDGKYVLRISDLKTGVTHVSPRQLEVYGAFFCLEYKFDPHDILIELRIYQNNEVQVFDADPYVIKNLMETIIAFDKRINFMKMEGLS